LLTGGDIAATQECDGVDKQGVIVEVKAQRNWEAILNMKMKGETNKIVKPMKILMKVTNVCSTAFSTVICRNFAF
jgi:hypothetical protein